MGSLSILAQVGWGGAYGDVDEDGKEWAQVLEELDTITEMNPIAFQEGYHQRDYLLLLSRFRGVCYQSDESGPNRHAAPLVLKRSGKKWEEVPNLTSWDEVRDFFRGVWFK